MDSGRKLAEAVKAVSQGGPILKPADEACIAQTEWRFGIHLPIDLREFYLCMNGTDCPTVPEHGWIRFWSLESWHLVRDEPSLTGATLYGDFKDAVAIADHCDKSWLYAADFSRPGANLAIYIIDGVRPAKLVAEGFTAFVKAALTDDPAVYPSDDNAG